MARHRMAQSTPMTFENAATAARKG